MSRPYDNTRGDRYDPIGRSGQSSAPSRPPRRTSPPADRSSSSSSSRRPPPSDYHNQRRDRDRDSSHYYDDRRRSRSPVDRSGRESMGGYRDLDRVTDRPDPRDRSWHQVARERDRERGWRHRDGERHSRQDDSRRDHRYDDDDRRADGSGSRFVPPPRERGPRRDDEGQYDQREQQRSRDRAEDKSLSGKAASQDSHEPSQPTSTKLTDTEPGEDDGVVEDSEQDMMAAMGFGGFGTTKGTKVEGNVSGSANVKKERTWRQYMNRKGGFNRQLDPVKQ